MNFVGKFDTKLPIDDSGAHSDAHVHVEGITSQTSHVPSDAIIVPDTQLLFNGDFKRSGVDLILSKDDHELVLHDYFKGEKRAALSSPDGAHLTGDLVNALTGQVDYAQADGSTSAGHVIGHVTKLTGTATAIRNGVSIILNNGDNVEKGDVVQSGSDSTLGITFIDGTVFGLSSNARMVLNEMIYDPNGSNNSSLLSLVAGTISFVAGETAKHGDMKIDTPVATMGIRGTAVLVEIDFTVPGQGGAPDAKFQVLVEPDGTTGSYILFDKNTMTPIATVNQAGQVLNISQGNVSITNSALTDAQKNLVIELFAQKFTNTDTNTKTASSIGSSTPDNQLSQNGHQGDDTTKPAPPTATVTASATPPPGTGGPTNPNAHVDGAPTVVAFGGGLTELLLTTHDTTDNDATFGTILFADINKGDAPTATVTIDQNAFTYQDAHGHDITAQVKANAQWLADVKAVEVNLVLTPDAGNNNSGSYTWQYSVKDAAFDFLAKGETLTLTYVAHVNDNFALNPEIGDQSFTITITGTNDVPVITSDQTIQHIDFKAGTATPGGFMNVLNNEVTSGTFAFTDPDLTDTHTTAPLATLTSASLALTPGATPLDLTHLETLAPTPMAFFERALSVLVQTDSTGTGNGSLSWNLASLPVYLADFIPTGQTLKLTYTITLTDSQGATDTKTVEVDITGANNPAEVWIHTTTDGRDGLWTDGQNWETGNIPVSTDDVIIITDQLHPNTPSYPVTIDKNTAAVANSVTMNDFTFPAQPPDKPLPPVLDVQADADHGPGSLTIGTTLVMSADSELDNAGTVNVGTELELLDQSGPPVVLNQAVISNSGTLNIDTSKATKAGDIQGNASVTNTGTIDLKGGTLNVLVDIENTDGVTPGQITVDTGAIIALGTDPNNSAGIAGGITGGTVTIDGTLDLTGHNFLKTGTLDNSGTVDATGAGNALDGETITNSSTIEANGGTLTIDSAVSFTNTGKLEAINDGTLVLSGETVANAVIDPHTLVTTNGTVTVDSSSTLNLENATISGGKISNSGTIEATSGTSTIKNTSSFTNSGTLEMVGAELDLVSTVVTNGNGAIIVDQAQQGPSGTLNLQDATINGGAVSTSTSTDVIEATSGANFIDNASSITNAGTIEANGGTLTIDSAGTFTNSRTLEAINNSTLKLISTIVGDAANGVTSVGAGSHIDLQNASLLQHTVSTVVGGEIDTVSGSSNTINTANGPVDVSGRVNNAGIIAIADNSSLTLESAAYINNTGTIELNSAGHNTYLYIDQGFAGFDGGGHVTLSDDTHNIIAAKTSGDQLTNNNNTISGAGEIGRGGLVLVNNNGGVIDADGQNTLKLDPLSLTNTGTIEATDGADLDIVNTTVTNSTGSGNTLVNGTIAAVGTNLAGTAHSSIGLQSAEIDGGKISITAQGAMVATSGINIISGAASITNSAGTLEANGAELDLVNSTVTNTNGTGINANNTGIVFLTGANATIKLETAIISGGEVDITGASDTIEATSGINAIDNAARISNAGTLEANGGQLTIDSALDFTNTGTLAAINSGTLVLYGEAIANAVTDPVTNLTSKGAVQVTGANATLDLQGASISGGLLTNSGKVDSTGTSALTDVGITNSGTIEVLSGILTIDPAPFTNSGTLQVKGGELDLTGETLSNIGTLQAINTGSILKLTDTTVNNNDGVAQDAIGTVTVGSGATLDLVRATISGGTISGSGTIATATGNTDSTLSGVTVSSGTTVTAAVGTLDLTGTIANSGTFLASGGTIDLENAAITGGTLGGTGTIATATGNTDSTLSGVTVSSGTTVTAAVGTLDLTGTIANSGTFLASGGTIDLENAAITGGTLSGGSTIATATGNTDSTLSGVTIASGTTVTAAVGTLDLTGTIANSGTFLASGGTIDLENASITAGTLGGTGTIATATGNTDSTLSGVTVSSGTTVTAAVGTLDLTGTIASSGTFLASGGTIDLENAAITGGTLSGGSTIATATGNTDSTLSGVTVSSGTTVTAAVGTLDLTGTIANSGTFLASGGTIDLENAAITGGTLGGGSTIATATGNTDSTLSSVTIAGGTTVTAAVGTLDLTGTIASSGTFLASGGTIDLENAAITGGTLSGAGTIATATGNTDSTLSGVTVSSGTTVTAAVGTLDLTGTIANSGTFLASGGTIDLENATITGGTLGGTSTIATATGNTDSTLSGVTVDVGTTVTAAVGTLDLTGTIANSGAFLASGGTIDLENAAITGGTLSGGSTIATATGNSDSTLSGVTIASGTTVTAAVGTLDLTGTIANSGTFLASGGTIDLENASITAGTLGGTGTIATATGNTDSTLSGVTVSSGTTVTAAVGTLDLTGTIANSGTFLASGGTIDLENAAITGGTLSGGSTIATATGNTDSTLSGVTVSSGTTVTAAVGTLDLTGTIANSGTFLASGGTIDLENAIIAGGTLGGTGTIATATGNTDSTLSGVTVSSGTTVTAAVGTLDLTGTIANSGTFLASGGTIDLENAAITGGTLSGGSTIATATGNTDSTLSGVTVSSGTTVTAAVGTLDLTGTIANSGTFLASGGTIDLENAAITGGTLGGTGTIATATGNTDSTLSGVTVSSGTTVTAAVGTLDLTGTIANSGTFLASGGTIDLENAAITGGTLSGGSTIATATGNTDSTLSGVTIASGTTVTAAVGTLDLTGTIANSGTFLASGGTIDLENASITAGTLGGTGTIATATGNTDSTLSGVTVSSGTTVTAAVGTLDLTGTIASSGTFLASGGTIDLENASITGGTLSGGSTIATATGNTDSTLSGVTIASGTTVTAAVGTLDLAGTIVNSGTFLASGGTIDLENAAITGGTLSGASTIATATGNTDSTLSGVTIAGGTTVTAAVGTLDLTGTIANSGTFLASGGTIDLENASITGGTLSGGSTIATATGNTDSTLSGVTVSSGTTVTAAVGTLDLTGTIANSGTFLASGGTIDLENAAITGGTLSGGSTIATATGNTDSTLSGVTVSSGTTVTAAVGTLDLTGTIANSGTFLASGGTIDLENAAITGGTLSGGSTIATATGNTDSTLSGVTIASGTTVTAAVGTLDLTGTIANSGAFLASGGTIDLENASITGGTLGGTGTIATVGAGSDSTLSGVTIASNTLVTASAGTTLDLTGTITNHGEIDAAASGGTLHLENATVTGGTLGGSATIDVTGDSTIQGVVNGGTTTNAILNNGGVTIESGQTLTLDAVTVTGTTISFAGTGDTLKIDPATSFGGPIAGIVDGDTIDLTGTVVTAATFDGSALTVTDGAGQQTYQISGPPPGETFWFQSDGAGGTDLVTLAQTLHMAPMAETGTEASPIALDLGITIDTNSTGDSLATLLVSDIPLGAVLSDGTNSFTATTGHTSVDVHAWTLSALTITPANDANFTLTVAATEQDTAGNLSTTTTSTEVVTVLPTPPTVVPVAETGVEGTPIALDLGIAAVSLGNDTNQLHSVTLTFTVPANDTYTFSVAGVNQTFSAGADQTLTLTPAQLAGLSITTLNDSNVSLSVSATQIDAEGNVGPAGTGTETVTVYPTAPTVVPVTVSGVEGAPIALNLGLAAVNAAGDGNTLHSVTLTFTVPTNDTYTFTNSEGLSQSFSASANPQTLTLTPDQLAGLSIATLNDSNVSLAVSATQIDADNNVSAAATGTELITVNPTAPTVTPVAVSGAEGTAIALNLGIAPVNAAGDGNTLNSVTLTFTVPAGDSYTFSVAGVNHTFTAGTNQSLTLTPAQLAGLSITTLNDSNVSLAVSATQIDAEGNVGPASTTTTETVTVKPTAPTVSWSPSPAAGTEDGGVTLSLTVTPTHASGETNTINSLLVTLATGATISDGTNTRTAIQSVNHDTINVLGWNLANLTVTPANGSAFQLTATATEKDGENNASTSTSVSETVNETAQSGYLWGTAVIPEPNSHLFNPIGNFDPNVSTGALLFGTSPSSGFNATDPTVTENVVLFDPFALPYRSGIQQVDTPTTTNTPFKYQVMMPVTASGPEAIVFYSVETSGISTLYQSVVSETASDPNASLTVPPTAMALEQNLSGGLTSLYTSYTNQDSSDVNTSVMTSYSVAWGVYDGSTYQAQFQIFPTGGNPSVVETIESLTGLAAATPPAWEFRSAGGLSDNGTSVPYASVVAVADGTHIGQQDVKFQGYKVDGTADANISFAIAPDLSNFQAGASNQITQPNNGASLLFTPNGVAGSGFSAGWSETVNDGSNHTQVEFAMFSGAGVLISQTTYQISDNLAQNIRIGSSSVGSGANARSIEYLAYGDANSTTVVEFDQGGHQIASITDNLHAGVTYNDFTILGDGRIALSYADGSQYTTDIFDLRQTGLSETLGTAGPNYIAGTEFIDTVIGGAGVNNFYDFIGSSTAAPADSFTGGSGGFNEALFTDARSNFTISLNAATVQSNDATHGGTLDIGNVQALAFGVSHDASPSSTGGLEVTNGETLVMLGNFASGNTYPVTIDTGGTLEIMAPSSAEAATFNGAATLQLDASQSYSGTVSGFGTGATVDLKDITFSSAVTDTWNSATDKLTVSDGTHTATLSFAGSYNQNSFALMSDANGKTEVVLSPAQASLSGLDGNGNAVAGSAVTATLTDSNASGLTYQWVANGVAISGATGSSFTPTVGYEGKALDVVIGFTDTGHSEQVTALAGTVATPPPPPVVAFIPNYFNFDGSTSAEGAVSTTHTGNGSDGVTLAGEVNWNGQGATGDAELLFMNGNGSDAGFGVVGIVTSNGLLDLQIQTGGIQGLDSGITIAANEWHNIALTHVNGNFVLYVDGVAAYTATENVNGIPGSPVHGNFTMVGGGPTEPDGSAFGGEGFRGGIANVSIWNTALTQSQVQSIANATLTGTETNLVSYFPLTDGSGTTASDPVSGSVNLTVRGTAGWVGGVDIAPDNLQYDVFPGLSISDPGQTNIDHATVTWNVTGGGGIAFGGWGFDAHNIAIVYDPGIGGYRLTGSDTIADYQDVLNHLTFQSWNVQTGTTFTVVVNDGTGSGDSAAATSTVDVAVPTTWDTWTGTGGDGNWNNSANWSHGVVPGSSHYAYVDAVAHPGPGTAAVTTITDDLTGSNPSVAQLHILSGTTLDITSSSSSSDTFDVTGALNFDVSLFIASVQNAGIIDVQKATFGLSGEAGNTGTIHIESGAVLAIDHDVTLDGGGHVSLELGSFVTAAGSVTLDNADNIISGAGTIGAGDGLLALQNDSNGTIDANDPTNFLAINTGNNITNAGLLEATAGGQLDVRDSGIANSGSILVDGSSTLYVDGSGNGHTLLLTLTGGGTLTLNGQILGDISSFGTLENVDNSIAGAGSIGNGDASLKLLNDGSGTIAATDATHELLIDTGGDAGSPLFLNGGLVRSLAAGGLEITSPVQNNGTFEASQGLFKVDSNYIGNGIALIDGGSMEFHAASDAVVQFSGQSAGTLILDNVALFNGSVTGFAKGDTIDLKGISDPSTVHVVSDTNGLHVDYGTGSFALVGNYNPADFTIAADALSTGTKITWNHEAPVIATDQFDVTKTGTSYVIKGLSVSETGASSTDTFKIDAVGAPGSVTPPTDTGTLTQINGDLATTGITDDSGSFPLPTGMVIVTVADVTSGATDTVNFIFNQAGTGHIALYGTAGKDVIFATGGSDTLTGGGGQDQFVFKPNSGPDNAQHTITDFVAGLDKIDLKQFSNITASSLAAAETQHGNDTQITLDSHDTLLLKGVTHVHASDFILHA